MTSTHGWVGEKTRGQHQHGRRPGPLQQQPIRCAGGTPGWPPRSEHRELSGPRLVVNRWRHDRHDRHDRLYVAHPEGVTLGRWDLATD